MSGERDLLVDRLESLLPGVDFVPKPKGWIAAVARDREFTALADTLTQAAEDAAKLAAAQRNVVRLANENGALKAMRERVEALLAARQRYGSGLITITELDVALDGTGDRGDDA